MSIYKTSDSQKIRVYAIATEMSNAGLSASFVAGAVELALIYEGVYDLMELWSEEDDANEFEQIIADIQEEIEEYAEMPKKPVKKPYISFDDLEGIAKDIEGFKKHLRTLVDQWGGINQLAKQTGIPQPSLSRFFKSSSMPRRTTLYKIANALGLSEREIITDWAA
ncbi:MAG: helix-turn-helix transcriptional regulator [Bacteriovoracaceae bacterium]|nr:helix-turn-helix transcriptional regulator [Bacteriovoracaceae bacterium]